MEVLNRYTKDTKLFAVLVKKIKEIVKGKSFVFMEVCGTHTHAISRTGIRRALLPEIKLLSGPGCPVCVTSQKDIDEFLSIENAVLVSFGDMVKVPGSIKSLEKIKEEGHDVRIVYSPLDALEMAENEPEKDFVFMGVGFETTIPLFAACIKRAKEKNIKNFFIYPSFKLIPPALYFIVAHPKLRIDGFLLPGHVSTIIGRKPYLFLAEEFRKPAVIAGFEPLDILYAVLMLVKQKSSNNPRVEIEYTRSVKEEGNPKAKDIIQEVFIPQEAEWRGLGKIRESGLRFKKEWEEFDAKKRFRIEIPSPKENPLCRCGEILLGKIVPPDCPLFGRGCTPENPYGPCMVSSEGACSAYYLYERQ